MSKHRARSLELATGLAAIALMIGGCRTEERTEVEVSGQEASVRSGTEFETAPAGASAARPNVEELDIEDGNLPRSAAAGTYEEEKGLVQRERAIAPLDEYGQEEGEPAREGERGFGVAGEPRLNPSPPPEFKKMSAFVETDDFIPGLGTLYVAEESLPVGPYLGYDHDGNLVNITFMIPLSQAQGAMEPDEEGLDQGRPMEKEEGARQPAPEEEAAEGAEEGLPLEEEAAEGAEEGLPLEEGKALGMKEGWENLRPGIFHGRIDHVDIQLQQGHPGLEEPHYHVVMWLIPHGQEAGRVGGEHR